MVTAEEPAVLVLEEVSSSSEGVSVAEFVLAKLAWTVLHELVAEEWALSGALKIHLRLQIALVDLHHLVIGVLP